MEIPALLDLSQHYLGAKLGGTQSQVSLRRVDQPVPFTLWVSPLGGARRGNKLSPHSCPELSACLVWPVHVCVPSPPPSTALFPYVPEF